MSALESVCVNSLIIYRLLYKGHGRNGQGQLKFSMNLGILLSFSSNSILNDRTDNHEDLGAFKHFAHTCTGKKVDQLTWINQFQELTLTQWLTPQFTKKSVQDFFNVFVITGNISVDPLKY